MRIVTLVLVICIALTACDDHRAKTKFSFYYWKTRFDIPEKLSDQLHKEGVDRIYLRLFDVVKDRATGKVIPEAVVQIASPVYSHSITPVVYLRNEVFSNDHPDSLAVKTGRLIKEICIKNGITYNEVQLDCDWTERTRDAYFTFINSIHNYLKCDVTCTIRLHQVKYPNITGIPPVKKGVLMFYNMGSLEKTTDTYLFSDVASGYLQTINSYPLTLDIALPYFEQLICYRDGHPYTIYKPSVMSGHQWEFERSQSLYIATASFYSQGIYIRKGDILKYESARNDTVDIAARLLSKHLKVSSPGVIYFDLPDTTINENELQKLKEIPSYFN